ncbi:MAG: AraC family transcriptional regulator, partial [Steroidobacteraceae bacterium]
NEGKTSCGVAMHGFVRYKFFVGSKYRYKFPGGALQAPARSRLLEEVGVKPANSEDRLRSTKTFTAAGFSLHHHPVDAPEGVEFQWLGSTHYLALHDMRLSDGEIFADGTETRQRKDLRGLMTFVPAGCRVWGWSVQPEAGHSFTALYMDPSQLEAQMEQKLLHIPSRPSIYFADPGLRFTLEKMQGALTAAEPPDAMYLETLCTIAVLELCILRQERLAIAAQSAGLLTNTLEARIADYIDANLHTQISLDDLAGLAGLSRFHFLRTFKRTTSETPYQFLLRRRIEKSRTLLASSGLSVAEISARVGFSDATRFIRTFRRIVGVTPGVYRK